MTIIKWFVIFLFFAPTIYADTLGTGLSFNPPSTHATYVVIEEFNCDSVNLTNTCLIITGGLYERTYCDSPSSTTIITIPYQKNATRNSGLAALTLFLSMFGVLFVVVLLVVIISITNYLFGNHEESSLKIVGYAAVILAVTAIIIGACIMALTYIVE